VIIGSRTVDKAQAAADKVKAVLGDSVSVRGAENLDAAKEADILVLTVPLPAQKSTLLSIKEAAAGKPLLDATGPLEATIGGSPTKYISLPDGSAAQRSQAILPGAKVICAFNNISEHCLMAVDGEIDCDCLICGNDKEAKAFVTPVIEKIPGVRSSTAEVLSGPVSSRRSHPLLIGLNIRNKSQFGGIRITGPR